MSDFEHFTMMENDYYNSDRFFNDSYEEDDGVFRWGRRRRGG